MKYWVSFGAFQAFELVADITISFIIPFYIELKLAAIMWLVLGTKLVFDSIVNRELTKREKSIDRCLNRVKKIRDEIVATIWFEISRCSVRIVTTLMSGGLSVLAKSEHIKDTSPNNSGDEEEEKMDTVDDHDDGTGDCHDDEEKETTVHYTLKQDFNRL